MGRLIELLDPGSPQTVGRAARELVRAGADPGSPAVAFRVPGRIEVVGKHTDYAGGRSLTLACDRGFGVVAVRRPEPGIRVLDAARRRSVLWREGRVAPGAPRWSVYPATALGRLAADFQGPAGLPAEGGAWLAFASDLPQAAGLASSSAFLAAVTLAVARLAGLERHPSWSGEMRSPLDLAGYLAAVERGSPWRGGAGGAGVGTRGGSEDPVAILDSAPGRLGMYRYAPESLEGRVRPPAGHRFVVAASGVRAEKTGSARLAYNRASDRVSRLVALGRRAGARGETLAAVLDELGPEALRGAVRRWEDGDERRALECRLDHYRIESGEVVPGVFQALSDADLGALGRWVERSQEEAEMKLENQVPETIALAREARALGAVAATSFGAGFGGAVWALVPSGRSAELVDAWRKVYGARFPGRRAAAVFFATTPEAGAEEILGDGSWGPWLESKQGGA